MVFYIYPPFLLRVCSEIATIKVWFWFLSMARKLKPMLRVILFIRTLTQITSAFSSMVTKPTYMLNIKKSLLVLNMHYNKCKFISVHQKHKLLSVMCNIMFTCIGIWI